MRCVAAGDDEVGAGTGAQCVDQCCGLSETKYCEVSVVAEVVDDCPGVVRSPLTPARMMCVEVSEQDRRVEAKMAELVNVGFTGGGRDVDRGEECPLSSCDVDADGGNLNRTEAGVFNDAKVDGIVDEEAYPTTMSVGDAVDAVPSVAGQLGSWRCWLEPGLLHGNNVCWM